MAGTVKLELDPAEWSDIVNALRAAAMHYGRNTDELLELAKTPAPPFGKAGCEALAKQFMAQAEYSHKYARYIEEACNDQA